MTKYVELDFAEITAKKAMAIKKNKELMKVLGQEAVLGTPKLYGMPFLLA